MTTTDATTTSAAATPGEPIYQVESLIAEDIDAYLEKHQHKTMLRFITCGSVDDGKSTLIGRMLYDSKMIFEDHLAALEADSKKVGTQGEQIDFALLVDGLTAERVIFKQLGAYVPGAVEKALGATKGLGAKPDLLPAGTTIVIPQPTEA